MFKFLRQFKLIGLAVLLTAMAAPQLGDLVELQGFVNARSSAAFRKSDTNKKYVLPVGTKAEVEEVKFFSGTGNYGMRVRLVNADGVADEDNATMWVYYDVKKPAMQLYSLNGNTEQRQAPLEKWKTDPRVKARATKKPELATDAVVIKPTPALPEIGPPVPAPYPDWRKQREEGSNQALADKIDVMNKLVDSTLPVVECPECEEQAKNFKACNSKNSYIEDQIDLYSAAGSKAAEGTELQTLLSIRTIYPQLSSCIRTGMDSFGAQSAKCDKPSGKPQLTSQKACVSPRLAHITEVGFSMTVDCLAGFLNGREGDQSLLKETFRSMIAVVNLESGFMMNAYNASSASGLGQMTGGTIDSLNNDYWEQAQAYINSSSNPTCQQIKKMDLKKIRPDVSHACERMSVANGNPVSNMVYAMAHLKSVRDTLESTLRRSLKAADLNLSAEFHEKLIGALTNWGHNLGPYGIAAPVKDLLRLADGQEALRQGNLDKFMRLLKVHVYQFHVAKGNSVRRSNEASSYYGNMVSNMKSLEREAGHKCEL